MILTDEKKFNLDGSDGLACYWHDIRKEPKAAWGCFFNGLGGISYYGAADLIRVKGNQDSVKYCQTLQYGLLRTC